MLFLEIRGLTSVSWRGRFDAEGLRLGVRGLKLVARGEVTRLLEQFEAGWAEAQQRLIPLVYDELRRIAASKIARERERPLTLQPTALLHEA
jgi:hypothetical protein